MQEASTACLSVLAAGVPSSCNTRLAGASAAARSLACRKALRLVAGRGRATSEDVAVSANSGAVAVGWACAEAEASAGIIAVVLAVGMLSSLSSAAPAVGEA